MLNLIGRVISVGALCGMFIPIEVTATEISTYSYDALGRVSNINHTGSGANSGLSLVYKYDLAGNRVTQVVTGSKNLGQRVIVVPLNGFTMIPVNP